MGSTRMTQTTLQILLSLSGGPLHGYGIKMDVAERTQGEMKLGSGTLYEAIQRLEEDGWIRPVPAPEEAADPRRQYYRLEGTGEEALRSELTRLDAVVSFARSRDLLPRPEEV